MTLCRSQHTYPTTAADYELDKEVGKGACGMVSARPFSAALRSGRNMHMRPCAVKGMAH